MAFEARTRWHVSPPPRRAYSAGLQWQPIGYVFIAPAVILFVIFVVAPIFASLFLSFTRYDVLHPPAWVGLDNFRTLLFEDPRFWKAFRNTVLYVVGVVPSGISLALLLAAALEELSVGKQAFKVLFFIPSVTSVVAMSCPPGLLPAISRGARLARAAYIAAVNPAGPDPMMISL